MASLVFPLSTHPLLIFVPRLFRLSLPVHSAVSLQLKRSKTTFADFSSEIVFHRKIGAHKWNRLQRRCCADMAVVSSDDKYGSKQVISVTPLIYDYLLTNVREPLILQELREETATMRGSQMQVSPDQAQLLAMLVQILGAKRCIEVGVYTGYSSLAVALVLPESGYLLACERDAISLEVAKKYYDRAGVTHKEYFELLLQLVRVGGLIVIDNVLWHGKVANPIVTDKKTVSIRNFNRSLMEDKRVSISMVPIGDGMTICRKL